MTLVLAGSLVALALIDSTSFGTLLIPIWLLLAPGKLRASRVLVFLGTVAAFYFLVGLILLAGAGIFLSAGSELLDSPVAARVQLVLGVGLVVLSFFIGKKKVNEDGSPKPGRMLRWRERAMGEGVGRGTILSLTALALGAALLEVATMLPYLAAIGLVGGSGMGFGLQVGVLAGYCVVMILPALVLLAGRLVARSRVEPLLIRISRWMEKSGAEASAWIVGILGFLIARDALQRLPDIGGVFQFLQ